MPVPRAVVPLRNVTVPVGTAVPEAGVTFAVKARAVADEGLALFPPASAGTSVPRTRKLLELEAEPKGASR